MPCETVVYRRRVLINLFFVWIFTSIALLVNAFSGRVFRLIGKSQFVIAFGISHSDFSLAFAFGIQPEHKFGEFIFEILLNGSFQRACAEVSIISLAGHKIAGLISEMQTESKCFQSAVEFFQLDSYNLLYRLHFQGIKHDYVVDTIQKLWRKRTVKGLGNHAMALLFADCLCVESHTGAEVFQLP